MLTFQLRKTKPPGIQRNRKVWPIQGMCMCVCGGGRLTKTISEKQKRADVSDKDFSTVFKTSKGPKEGMEKIKQQYMNKRIYQQGKG